MVLGHLLRLSPRSPSLSFIPKFRCCPLRSMSLQCDVSIEVVEGAVALVAPWPLAKVHAVDLLVRTTGTFPAIAIVLGDSGRATTT